MAFLGIPTRNAAHTWGNAPNAAAPSKSFSKAEIAKHNEPGDCWVIVDGGVYNVSKYLTQHPGGSQLIFRSAGKDCTQDFEAMFHSKKARMILEELKIGVCGKQPGAFKKPGVPIRKMKLIEVIDLTHDTKKFVFTLAQKMDKIPVGHHVCILNDKRERKPYTPTYFSGNRIEFVIKNYPNGNISSYIHSLEPGATVKLTKSIGTFKQNLMNFKHIWLIAGGTGITPLYQLLCALQSNNYSNQVELFYCNKTPNDVLLEKELKEFSFLKLIHCFSKDSSQRPNGRISRAHIETHLTKRDDMFVGVCGPLPFNRSVESILKEIELQAERFFFE